MPEALPHDHDELLLQPQTAPETIAAVLEHDHPFEPGHVHSADCGHHQAASHIDHGAESHDQAEHHDHRGEHIHGPGCGHVEHTRAREHVDKPHVHSEHCGHVAHHEAKQHIDNHQTEKSHETHDHRLEHVHGPGCGHVHYEKAHAYIEKERPHVHSESCGHLHHDDAGQHVDHPKKAHIGTVHSHEHVHGPGCGHIEHEKARSHVDHPLHEHTHHAETGRVERLHEQQRNEAATQPVAETQVMREQQQVATEVLRREEAVQPKEPRIEEQTQHEKQVAEVSSDTAVDTLHEGVVSKSEGLRVTVADSIQPLTAAAGEGTTDNTSPAPKPMSYGEAAVYLPGQEALGAEESSAGPEADKTILIEDEHTLLLEPDMLHSESGLFEHNGSEENAAAFEAVITSGIDIMPQVLVTPNEQPEKQGAGAPEQKADILPETQVLETMLEQLHTIAETVPLKTLQSELIELGHYLPPAERIQLLNYMQADDRPELIAMLEQLFEQAKAGNYREDTALGYTSADDTIAARFIRLGKLVLGLLRSRTRSSQALAA